MQASCGIMEVPRHAYAVLQLLTIPGRVYACLGRPSQRPYRVSLFNRSANMTSGIYCITNTKNKKRYIGSSSNINKRLHEHRTLLRKGKHHSRHLQAAWDKYGEEAFSFDLVCTCEPEDLLAQEQFWIDSFQAANDKYGYNIALKAGSNLGVKLSSETRAKISAAGFGRRASDETRAKLSVALRGKKRTDETRARISAATSEVMQRPGAREKLSAAAKGRKLSPEAREKISAANLGRKMSDKARAALLAASVGKKLSDETKAKLSAYRLGRKHTAEARERMSAAQRKSLARPEVRAKIVAKAIGRKASNETKAKMSVVQRGENNPMSKLTDDNVREIRQLLAAGVAQTEIAARFGVARTIISRIKLGEIWRHVK